MKKKIDEYQIYEKHYEEIYNQVKNDPNAQSLGIQLKKFEAHNYNRSDCSIKAVALFFR
ncbi:hypothetical protein [Neobacillus sp. SuZ13]|uniref:hypothetical protein n=1 Tax=Neobacillus sp. SuZ13 TaxID=3047875 RepID=UPI0024BF85F5|nr:hypothetical protein [Neobacillus sp. SuZ13]WHY69448.1 hypothetical protein QNH17_12745 [Neobacillus sp. SuZ13]